MTYMKLVIATITMLAATISHAERVNHDVSGFDIAGITLGMGSEEAIAAMAELTGVPLEDMNTSFPEANPVTGQDEITYATAATDDFEISISLSAAVPPNKNQPLIVSRITFQMPRSPENIASMRTRALEKYGAPTDGKIDDPDHFDLAWCMIPADNPTASCSSGVGKYLELRGGLDGLRSVRQLTLFDISYSDAVGDFVNGENSSEPKF